jgi:uncharacterized membrane protein HdeD (DUF308 family)
MNNLSIDKAVHDKLEPHTLITGILLIMLGTAGIILPGVMSPSTVLIVGWLLLLGGILWVFRTYKYCLKIVMDWLKPALLLVIGRLMLLYPVPFAAVAATLGGKYVGQSSWFRF